MARSSNTEKTKRLNAAFDLLAQGYALADAAEALAQKFGLSRRQAYRYLQDAQVSMSTFFDGLSGLFDQID